MIKVYSPHEIRAAEVIAMADGVSEITLMEEAAQGLLSAVMPYPGKVAIVTGKGNNAGDGYALACLLAQMGREARLIRLHSHLTSAAEHYYALCQAAGVELTDQPDFAHCGCIVDCIFGTGFHGTVDSPYREAIDAINSAHLPVIAADIPSGLSALSGLGDRTVMATVTVAIGGYKYGHFQGRGRDVCGRILLHPISIAPEGGIDLIEDTDLAPLLSPRPAHCHKGTFGTAVLLGGCLPYSGAPRLAMLAASSLRLGCGIARLAIPACLANAALPYLLEGTLCPLPHQEGHLILDTDALRSAFAGASAAAVGMGMGQSDDIASIVRWALDNLSVPLVIDADGLNALAGGDLSCIAESRCTVILTPHPKEFSRLSGLPMGEILADPISTAMRFAKAHCCILLLKGSATVVTDGNRCYLIARGSGGMATAGSGDVLSGVLAGLLAHSAEDPLLSTAAGAYLCGVAGEIAARRVGTISMIASDTVSALPEAILQTASAQR